jgi:hypothetical protein
MTTGDDSELAAGPLSADLFGTFTGGRPHYGNRPDGPVQSYELLLHGRVMGRIWWDLTGEAAGYVASPHQGDLAHNISGRWTKKLSESRGRGLPASEAVAELLIPGVLPPDAGVLSSATRREFTSLDGVRVFEP